MKPKAEDIMHRHLLSIDPDATIPMLERALVDAGVSGLPVAVHGRLVGVVCLADVVRRLCLERDRARANVGLYGRESAVDYMSYDIGKDVADLAGERMDRLHVRDLMSEKVVTVSPHTELHEMTELLVKHRIGRLPVVEDAHVVGVVMSRDVIRALAAVPIENDRDAEHELRDV